MDETTEAILLIQSIIRHLHGAEGCPTCTYKPTPARAGVGHDERCAWKQLEDVCYKLIDKTR